MTITEKEKESEVAVNGQNCYSVALGPWRIDKSGWESHKQGPSLAYLAPGSSKVRGWSDVWSEAEATWPCVVSVGYRGAPAPAIILIPPSPCITSLAREPLLPPQQMNQIIYFTFCINCIFWPKVTKIFIKSYLHSNFLTLRNVDKKRTCLCKTTVTTTPPVMWNFFFWMGPKIIM